MQGPGLASLLASVPRIGIKAAPAASSEALRKAEEAVGFIMYAVIAAVAVGVGLLILNSLGKVDTNLQNVTQTTSQTIGTYFNTFVTVLVLGGIVVIAGLILKKLIEAFRAR